MQMSNFIVFILLTFSLNGLPTCEESLKQFTTKYTCEPGTKGKGASAVAYVVKDEKGERLLLKIQSVADEVSRKKVNREVNILRQLSHPNIVKLHKYKTDKEGKYAYYIMQLGEKGTLKDQPAITDKQQILRLFKKLAEAVNFIHKHNFVHTDLKAENIVFTSQNEPLIIDFDLALKLGDEQVQRGSLPYMDLAIVKSKDSKFVYTESVDIYSLGVIFYEIVHKKVPFKYDNLRAFTNRINKGEYEIQQNVDVNIINIIHQCLMENPKQRLGLDDIIVLINEAMANAQTVTLAGPVTISNSAVLPERVSTSIIGSMIMQPKESELETVAQKELHSKQSAIQSNADNGMVKI